MKTPRELLIGHHRQAQPKLDALRRAAVAQIRGQQSVTANPNRMADMAACLQKIWCELFLPVRHVWTGLAAVWVLLLFINARLDEPQTVVLAKSPSSPTAGSLTLREQHQLLAELTASETVSVAVPPKRNTPRPRSEITLPCITV
jgi:hypothetical protein